MFGQGLVIRHAFNVDNHFFKLINAFKFSYITKVMVSTMHRRKKTMQVHYNNENLCRKVVILDQIILKIDFVMTEMTL